MCRRGGGQVPATHKVEETVFGDTPEEVRHNWTQYVCCAHFQKIFGLNPDCWLDRLPSREKFLRSAVGI